ncbi:MAG: M23 family metallopeptidase [Pseudomonadota bacterium]|nr:M23 family metallopeptidase [Pseudomonadota bacterium]
MLAAVAYAFRERQIYLRSEGEVQFITLRPFAQAVGLASLLVGLFWLAFSSINIAFKDQLLALRERGMYDARLEYEDRIAGMRKEIDKLNDRLMIDQGEYLGKIDDVRLDYEKLVDRHRKLVDFFRQTANRRGRSAERRIFDDPLPAGPKAPGEANDSLGRNTIPGKNDLNEESFAVKYGSEFRTEADGERPLQDLGQMFARYERMEIALLDEAIINAEKAVSEAKKIFSKVGIDGKRVAARSKHKPEAVGGPFIAATRNEGDSDEVSQRMEKVFDAHATFEKLKFETRRLPVAKPLGDPRRISSGFGIRRDPFRRTFAMHAGVDFRNPAGTAVLATADGRVVAAGWEGAYGRMVEISHDNGVSTRYAHLSGINVVVGQRVASGSVVGKIGNTGRSTGPHLHYETRVNKRALDPAKFWQVQHAVQELWQEE